ncbi:MAG: cell division protein CrgA [Actinomycetaceae bacterium]|nr:cell division protein CrgA [Actinomycetaceae bacterium]MDY6082413.1 cell division protein CrgA [Actinomycetaceae bacterium]
MPESEQSKKAAPGTKRSIEQQETKRQSAKSVKRKPKREGSPRWWAPVMVTLMIVGLLVVVLAYIFGGRVPIPGFGNGNLALGFGLMLIGFLMTMGWK